MNLNSGLKFTLLLLTLVFALTGCSDAPPQLTPLLQDRVILTFGDSLTYGTGANKGNDYPSVLADLTGREIINAGVPGELSGDGLKRLPELLAKHQPSLLILIHGGNDILRKKSPAETSSNLEQMISLARNADTQVIMMAVPKPGLLLSAAPFYAQVASSNNVPIDIDTLASVLRSGDTKSDTVHPNDAGYRIIAEHLQQLLIDTGAL